MRLLIVAFPLLTFLTALAPGAAAACTPGEIDYVVGVEYTFTCADGFWRGALAVDFSQQQAAIDLCFGSTCWEGCGNILFYGTGSGRVTMDFLNTFVLPELTVCTATAGTLYLY